MNDDIAPICWRRRRRRPMMMMMMIMLLLTTHVAFWWCLFCYCLSRLNNASVFIFCVCCSIRFFVFFLFVGYGVEFRSWRRLCRSRWIGNCRRWAENTIRLMLLLLFFRMTTAKRTTIVVVTIIVQIGLPLLNFHTVRSMKSKIIISIYNSSVSSFSLSLCMRNQTKRQKKHQHYETTNKQNNKKKRTTNNAKKKRQKQIWIYEKQQQQQQNKKQYAKTTTKPTKKKVRWW